LHAKRAAAIEHTLVCHGCETPSILVTDAVGPVAIRYRAAAADHRSRALPALHLQRPTQPRAPGDDAVLGGKCLHVTLHLEPEPLLTSRGFHWINEVPFNHPRRMTPRMTPRMTR